MGFQESFFIKDKRQILLLLMAMDRREILDSEGEPYLTQVDTFFEKLRPGK